MFAVELNKNRICETLAALKEVTKNLAKYSRNICQNKCLFTNTTGQELFSNIVYFSMVVMFNF